MKNIWLTRSIIIVLLLFYPQMFFCQEQQPKSNTVYLEIGGNNVFYSINYEKELLSNLSPRIGISIMPISEYSNAGKQSNSKLFISLMANYFIDLNTNNKIEIGVGASYGLETFFPAISFGYRYSPNNGGFVFKLAFTPLLNREIFDVFPWFGIGLGIRY